MNRLLVLYFVFFTISESGWAGNYSFVDDSVSKKYPLSDPRNPHCPCHRIQKRAEKEFRAIAKQTPVTVLQKKKQLLRNKMWFDATLAVFQQRRKGAAFIMKIKRPAKGKTAKYTGGFSKKRRHDKISACFNW